MMIKSLFAGGWYEMGCTWWSHRRSYDYRAVYERNRKLSKIVHGT